MSSRIRFSGMASGLDTDELVKNLMKTEQLKLDNLKGKKTYKEWSQTAYRDMIKLVNGFKEKYFDVLKKDTYLKSPATFSANKVKSSDSEAVSVNSYSTVGNYTRKIEVKQKAESAKVSTGLPAQAADLELQGLHIEAKTAGTVGNDYALEIKQATGNSIATTGEIDANGKVVITLGTDGSGNPLSVTAADIGGLTFTGAGASLVDVTVKDGTAGLSVVAETKLAGGAEATSHVSSFYDAMIANNAVTELKKGFSMAIVLDGDVKKITIDEDVTGSENVKNKLQELLTDAFGTVNNADGSDVKSKIQVSVADDKLTFKLDDRLKTTSKVEFFDSGNTDSLKILGFGEMQYMSNRFNVSQTAKNALSTSDKLAFKINGKAFEFELTTTNDKGEVVDSGVSIDSILKTINSSPESGVLVRYDEIADQFHFESKNGGTVSKIDIDYAEGSAGEKLFKNIFKVGSGELARGKDAIVNIDGNTLYRSSNNFTVDGVSYELKKAEVGKTIDITVESDTENAIKAIKDFVADYNGMIKGINDKLVEKKYRSFTPLTDEQRKSMEEADIKLWEGKAKSGILRYDPILTNMVGDMRDVLNRKINGISLAEIGITTSKDYKENGKLEIDEEKLTKALETRGTEIADLFAAKGSEAGSEKGLAVLLEEVVNRNVGTLGEKGLLLKKAGIEGDRTLNENFLEDEIQDYDKRIKAMVTRLAQKEDEYYNRFARLETMMNKMSQQSSWLQQQLGGGQ